DQGVRGPEHVRVPRSTRLPNGGEVAGDDAGTSAMPRQSELTKTAAIDEVARHLHERLPAAAATLAETCAREDYGGAAPAAVEALSPLDRYGAAVSLWAFAADRGEGEFKVRVYSPRLEDHGWLSPHTVVEIVSDDM